MNAPFPTAVPPQLRRLLSVAETFLSMSGWRLGHLDAAWVAGGLASLALGRLLIARNDTRATLVFYAWSLVFYYGGNSAILGSELPARLIRRHGEDRAFRLYESVVAIMFSAVAMVPMLTVRIPAAQ